MVFDGLIPYGWNTAVAERFAAHHDSGRTPGRVTAVDRTECAVMTGAGPVRAHNGGHQVCTGDWVALADGPASKNSDVAAVVPRRSAITRSAVSGQSQPQVLAANVDTVLVCAVADAPLRLGRIERMLSLAWESGAQPVVVLTKADTAADIAELLRQARSAAPGAAVVAVSATSGAGLDVLTAMLSGTVALLGPSGAGKSTLANALLGSDVFATGRVRAADGKGRHTTVRRELVPLPGGGTLIDTPGLRAAGLIDASDGLERTFSDIETLAATCRFTDCQHHAEPGCAVLAAVTTGQLAQRRLDSYRKLTRENEWMAARADARLDAERKRTQRAQSRTQRAMYRARSRKP